MLDPLLVLDRQEPLRGLDLNQRPLDYEGKSRHEGDQDKPTRSQITPTRTPFGMLAAMLVAGPSVAATPELTERTTAESAIAVPSHWVQRDVSDPRRIALIKSPIPPTRFMTVNGYSSPSRDHGATQNSMRAPSSTMRFGGMLKKSVVALALRAMNLKRYFRH